MRFSLLGPLVVADSAGGPVTVTGPRLRVLLAALLLHANTPVPAAELAEVVWDGSPPSSAVMTLRTYVKRLRGAVDPGAARIAAHDPGYVIRVEQEELDILEFEVLCRDARAGVRAGQWADASATAARALELWRAAPLLDVPSEALRGEFVPHLERLRLQVLEDCFDAGLRLEHHQELIPQLLDVTARYPLQERFHTQLMLALASTGRRAQALGAYQQARRVLVDELGIEPGPELRDIHRQVLAGDLEQMTSRADGIRPDQVPGPPATGAQADFVDALATTAAMRPGKRPAESPISAGPAQLPGDITDFTGRQSQAAYLYRALVGHEVAAGPGRVRVAVVAGAAGLGKTTLALRVAHQLRDLFPDGQLYAHLSSASGEPAVPGEVLARFLRDLGADSDKIPAGEEERAALYRTRVAGRRLLILLDDAKDAAQVRPLLPGNASCAVLVTTRNRTPYLLSTGFVYLDGLPDQEAQELFSNVAGEARAAAEPEATAEILLACAGLPLAIRICAARLATRPQWRIATMAARLRDERRRLDELQVADLEVRASFQVSYDSLRAGRHRADPAGVFRLLGLWQGQRISLPAAAALTGEREEDLADVLEALIDVSLLESPEPDWYQLHDLLRLFAAERAQAEEKQEARLRAVMRLLQWYLATAAAAVDLLSPYHYRIPADEPPAPGPPPASVQDALAWYDNEEGNLIAVTRQAAAAGHHEIAWRLPSALFPFFLRRHSWASCVTANRIAVNSAGACGSRPGEALARHNLGYVLARLGDVAAFSYLQEASAIRQEMNDLSGEAQAVISLTEAHYRIHGPQAAYDHSLRVLGILREAGNPALLGIGLNNHGDICLALGKPDEAAEYLQEALGILTSTGIGNGHGQVMENLGRVHLESGRFPEAIASLSEARRLYLAQGNLMEQGAALKYLAEAQCGANRADQAKESLEAALALFIKLKAATEVDDIHAALAALVESTDPAAR
jgi:DNA-binding SARP family transcriptional activator/tetratricopeptide (TPR) repeat protein